MLKKFFTYLLPIAAAILSSCSDDIFDLPSNEGVGEGIVVDGDRLTLSGSMMMPEMTEAITRGMADAPDYASMHLWILEFVDNGDPLSNTFSALYEAEQENVVTERGVVEYRLTLKASAAPRILHLVALPKGESLKIGYGVEASVVPALKTSDGTDAYWRRLEFPRGYCSLSSDEEWEPLPELKEKLTNTGLIRNFAKISVTDRADNFTVTGFDIINNPKQGSVAPWDAERRVFPEFVAADGATPIEYRALAASYKGIVPAGLSFSNTVSGGVAVRDGLDSKYLYERPVSDLRHTYIIIKGIRNGKERFYKLDIGQTDNTGLFNFYPLLRNFDYNIVINSVNAEGYASASEAAEGLVYNNLSFDVELSSLLNMSDGKEIVFVNFTTAVLTDPAAQTIEFKYRYKNLTTNKYENVKDVTQLGLVPGDVISKVVDKGTGADNWHTIELTIHPATAETRTQSFTIVKKSGLGRTIDLVLHQRWDFEQLKVFNGEHTNWTASTAGSGVVLPESSKPFTLFFDLPDNLPSAVFPMTFFIESDNQNIENRPGTGHMSVTSAPTLFDNSGKIRIQYKRVVTWTEYNTPVAEGGALIENPDGSQTHRVNCLFQTVMAMKDLYPTVTSGQTKTETTTIAIDNENYTVGKVTFTRTYKP